MRSSVDGVDTGGRGFREAGQEGNDTLAYGDLQALHGLAELARVQGKFVSPVDVLLAEDDPMLGGLISEGLEPRGPLLQNRDQLRSRLAEQVQYQGVAS